MIGHSRASRRACKSPAMAIGIHSSFLRAANWSLRCSRTVLGSLIGSFVRGLIALAERLQQRQRWAILHRLTEGSRVLLGRNLYSCTLLSPRCLSRNLHGPYFCMRTMDWPNMPMLLHSRDRCWGIFLSLCRHNPRRGILNGPYLPRRCERILVGRPSLKLLNQDFGRRPAIFRLTLTG
jgi:hypothetical protein